MMDVRHARSADLAHLRPQVAVAGATALAPRRSLHLSLPLVAGAFGIALLADAIHPVALILLQIYLAF